MTMIRTPTVPYAEGEIHIGRNGPRAWPSIWLVGVSALVLTVLNLAAATYLLDTSREMRLVDEKLEELAAFDTRIRAKLDTINNGLQAQFDKLNSNLDSRFADLDQRQNGLVRAITQIDTRNTADDGRDRNAGFPPPSFSISSIAVPVLAPTEPPPAASSARPSHSRGNLRPRDAEPPPPSTAFQRIESPNGRVHYKKIR